MILNVDWGLEIGDWWLGPIRNTKSQITNHKYQEQGLIKGYSSFCRVHYKRGQLSNVLVEKKKKTLSNY